jgi:mono/diheme cytochrome c family protein
MLTRRWKGIATGALSALCLFGLWNMAAVAEDKPAARKSAAPAAVESAAPILWTDLNGNGYGPVQLRTAAATVFVFVSTECPLANAYAARLRELEETYFPKRVSFFLVNAHPTDTPEGMRTWARERNLTLPLVRDAGGALTDRLGAKRTPEAIVVNRDGEIVYRGRVDDNKDPKLARRGYLRDAIEATLTGKPVAAASVPVADGCLILRPEAPKKPGGASAVTYARDIAPLLNKNCVSCHRKGEVGPMALDSYAQAKLWAPMLADVAERRIMPPWKAAPGYGDFHNTRSLTDKEIAALSAWAKSGAPSGDLKTAPKPPVFPADWSQGKPDVVLKPERPYTLGGDGEDVYRCFVLPAEFKQDTYVKLTQVKPDNRSVVHHVILYVDPSGKKSLEMDAKDPEDGFDNPVAGAYMLAGWAPGNDLPPMPEGIAAPIPKGARLVMEVHYHRSGRPEKDQTAVGLTFARETVRKIPQLMFVVQPGLNLTPGDPHIRVTGRMTIGEDVSLQFIAPHMHQIGKEMHVWATRPDGTKEELIWLKNWDFQWQTAYQYRKPVSLPKGTKVEMEAFFDNSAENPRNPNRPPKRITWGESSTEEMCVAFFAAIKDAQQLTIQPAPWQETVSALPDGEIYRLVDATRAAASAASPTGGAQR